jgi:hypothetical protein
MNIKYNLLIADLIALLLILIPCTVHAQTGCIEDTDNRCAAGGHQVDLAAGQYLSVRLLTSSGDPHPSESSVEWFLLIPGEDNVYHAYSDHVWVEITSTLTGVYIEHYGTIDCSTAAIQTATICDTRPTIGSGSDVEVEWYDAGCNSAQVASCSASANPEMYVNGINAGTCYSTPIAFEARPYMSNTITLVSDTSFDLYSLDVQCTDVITTYTTVTRTAVIPTPETYTTTASGAEVLSGGGFLGINFGGNLSNPSAPINIWLGYATDFVNIVNTGNILYIIGAVGGAGAVLGWAIHTVRKPEGY